MGETHDEAHEMIRGLETMLAEQGARLEAVAEVMRQQHAQKRLWIGVSGSVTTGSQIVAHLTAAAKLLQTEGWAPTRVAMRFGLADVQRPGHSLYSALGTIMRSRAGDWDTYSTGRNVLNLVVCASTGAAAGDYKVWEITPGRTAVEVAELLDTAIGFARRYGPTARSGSGR